MRYRYTRPRQFSCQQARENGETMRGPFKVTRKLGISLDFGSAVVFHVFLPGWPQTKIAPGFRSTSDAVFSRSSDRISGNAEIIFGTQTINVFFTHAISLDRKLVWGTSTYKVSGGQVSDIVSLNESVVPRKFRLVFLGRVCCGNCGCI
jgi:hypothetical protein